MLVWAPICPLEKQLLPLWSAIDREKDQMSQWLLKSLAPLLSKMNLLQNDLSIIEALLVKALL